MGRKQSQPYISIPNGGRVSKSHCSQRGGETGPRSSARDEAHNPAARCHFLLGPGPPQSGRSIGLELAPNPALCKRLHRLPKIRQRRYTPIHSKIPLTSPPFKSRISHVDRSVFRWQDRRTQSRGSLMHPDRRGFRRCKHAAGPADSGSCRRMRIDLRLASA